ncbi:MAG: hypothetical protein KatS3mg105_3614 [Gemmatales bacterium]|nr:MAG: hypothetical protein KatS3mg105_3614 [Gemmatales bacterium]
MVQANGYHRYRSSFQDDFKAAVKRHDKTSPRDTSLGKDANDIAVGKSIGGSMQRFQDGSRTGSAVNRNDSCHAQQDAQKRNFGIRRPDDKADKAMLSGEQ